MAKFRLDTILNFSTINGHTSTDWELATEDTFTDVIYKSYKDTVNLREWNIPMAFYENAPETIPSLTPIVRINCEEPIACDTPIPCGTGEAIIYPDDLDFYIRARVYYEEPASKTAVLETSPEYTLENHRVVSDWFVVHKSQLEQEVVITYPDGSEVVTSATALGWNGAPA